VRDMTYVIVLTFRVSMQVLNLKHLVSLIEAGQNSESDFNVILLEDNRSIVLCKTAASQSHDQILQRHRIPSHLQL
jgi:hypothetical protein